MSPRASPRLPPPPPPRGGAGCPRLPRDTASPRPGPGGGGGHGCTCRHGSARLSTARHSSAQPCRQPRRRARRCRGALRPAGTAAAPPAATQVGRDAAGPSFRARGGTPGGVWGLLSRPHGCGTPVEGLRLPQVWGPLGRPLPAAPPEPRGHPGRRRGPRRARGGLGAGQERGAWWGRQLGAGQQPGELAGRGARSAEHGPGGAARHGARCRQLPAPGTASGGQRPGEKMEPRALRWNGAMQPGLQWEMNQSSLASSSPPSTPVSLLNLGRGARFQSSLAGLGAVNLLPIGLWP